MASRDAEVLEIYRVAEQETAQILQLFCRLLKLERGPRITHLGDVIQSDRSRSTVPGPVLTWVLDVRKILMEPKHKDHWIWTYRAIVLGHRYELIARDNPDHAWREIRRAVFSSVMYMAARRRDLKIGLRPEG